MFSRTRPHRAVAGPRSARGFVARAGLSTLVSAGLLLASMPAQASPWAPPSAVSILEASSAPAAPATVDAALAAGDLETAKTLAAEARRAEPTAAHWQREGEVLEQAGEYGPAAKAYQGALAAAGDDAAAATAAKDGLTRVRAAARGTVADEPASTHREQLDEHWEPPRPAPEAEPTPEPLPPEAPPERIVTKWYFWLTVGAIVASAAAVTTIAIRASRDDQPDALDSFTRGPSRGLGVLRF